MNKAKVLSRGLLVASILSCVAACRFALAMPVFENKVYLAGSKNAEIQGIEKLIGEKQFDAAMSALEKLEKTQPNNATILNLKGAVYMGRNDRANARKSFELAFSSGAEPIIAAMNLTQLDLQDGKADDARKRFQSILAKDRNNTQAMIGLAGIAAVTGQENEYVAWLQKAAEAAPNVVRPRILLARHYLQKNEVQKALAMARQAQLAAPMDAEALDTLATAQLAAGESANAVTTYTSLAKVAPGNPTAHYKLASAYAVSGNAAAAKASLGKALALKPDYLDAEVLLAAVELAAGRHGEALKLAQDIQKKHPKSASGAALQGDVLLAQKKYPAALKAYESALALNKTGALLVKVHQALSADGKTKEAEARVNQWLQERPGDTGVRMYLASTHLRAGRSQQALEQYELIIKADPNNARALNDLAWLYHQKKDARALATAEQAYRLNPSHPEIMDTLGLILVDQGKTARGLELLQDAAGRAPASTAIRYHLAQALVRSGDKARARKELETLLAGKAAFPQRERAQALLREL